MNLLDVSAGRILIKDALGEDVLDTDREALHGTGYLQGSTTLPRVALSAAGQPVTPPVIDADVTLGSANNATVLGGSWRLSNAEGLALGEIRLLGDEEPFTRYYRRRHLYAPRIQQDADDWYPIGGPIKLDMYMFLYSVDPFTIQTSGSNVPEVGRLWHDIQFIIQGGNVKLIRRGYNIAHEYIWLVLGPDRYAHAFDCAALTIDYRIWLGRFT